MILTLPWPPSINHYWRHVGPKVLISAEGRSYRKAVAASVWERSREVFGKKRLNVEFMAYPPDRRRRDLDNLFKGALDALGHAGLYNDDSQIDRLTIERSRQVPSGKLIVKIEHYLETA